MVPLVLASLLTAGGPSQAETHSFPPQAHRAYAEVLKLHVKDGRVDYRGIKARSLKKLDLFLTALAETQLPPDRNKRIGLLIDGYNAIVLRAVIQHGRPRSVLDVKGFFNKETHVVAGQQLTLDTLEKKVLNPYAKDPRTHFVLVCGAVGCPILESQPFFGSQVDSRMAQATRRYLGSPHGAKVSEGQLAVSKIFDWYAKDFGGPDSARDFILQHLSENRKKQAGSKPKVSFVDYNWTLNQS